MSKKLNVIVAIIVVVVVVLGIYYYALPKGPTQPVSAVNSLAPAHHASTASKSKPKSQLPIVPSSDKVAGLLGKTAYFQQGLNTAKLKLYVFLDPNCIWCHKFFDMVQPGIAKGEIAVRWIVIGAVRPSSPGKAKAILASPSPIAALRLNESMFKEQMEEGGISPAINVSSAVEAKFKQNMDTANAIKLSVTPVIFFYTPNGQFVRYNGGMPESLFNEFLSHVGDKF